MGARGAPAVGWHAAPTWPPPGARAGAPLRLGVAPVETTEEARDEEGIEEGALAAPGTLLSGLAAPGASRDKAAAAATPPPLWRRFVVDPRASSGAGSRWNLVQVGLLEWNAMERNGTQWYAMECNVMQ